MNRANAIKYFARSFASWGPAAIKRIRSRTKRYGVLLSAIQWNKGDLG